MHLIWFWTKKKCFMSDSLWDRLWLTCVCCNIFNMWHEVCSHHLRSIKFRGRIYGMGFRLVIFGGVFFQSSNCQHETSFVFQPVKSQQGIIMILEIIEVNFRFSFWSILGKTCFETLSSVEFSSAMVNTTTELLAFDNIACTVIYWMWQDGRWWWPDEVCSWRQRISFDRLVFMAADTGLMDWTVASHYGSRNDKFILICAC